MGVYERDKGIAGAKKNLWIKYTITEDLRVRHGLTSRSQREAGGDSQRAANALLAQRRREIRDDTWLPLAKGGGKSGQTLRQYGEVWLAQRKAANVKSHHNEQQRLRNFVFPVLGDRRLVDIRRQDVKELIAAFQATKSKKTGKLPAPRTVHHVYEDLRALYAQALEVDELVIATPCTLKARRGELPKKKDADPRWRSSAVFTRQELELLICDERIDLHRRVTYALMFLTGARIGEVSGLLWRDYDPLVRPLGRLVVATTYGGQETKTETPREVPVHPVLAALLATWKLEGFPLWIGKRPQPDDYIVPRVNRRNSTRPRHPYLDRKQVWQQFQKDLLVLGLRPRRVHDSRRTFISLARADGARKDILDWITHGPSNDDMQDLYTTLPWETVCEQVSCVRIELRKDATVARLRRAASARDL